MTFVKFDLSPTFDNKDLIFLEVETARDNQHLTNGSIVCCVVLEEDDNKLDYISDGDFVQLHGSAGTNNSMHLVQVFECSGDYELVPTSSLVQLEKKIYNPEELKGILYGKIIFSFKQMSKDYIGLSSDRPPRTKL